MMDVKMIGDKIAQARKKINISQAQLAEQVFVSPQAVGKWERGESIPDIITLNRLAEIFGVDLNYFSEKHTITETEITPIVPNSAAKTVESLAVKLKRKLGWDMSQGNWVDADFSGLKDLNDKLSASNIKNSKFIDSELSGLLLKSNNVESCDFSNADLSKSQIQTSNLTKNTFSNCSLQGVEFSRNNISDCDFSNADLSEGIFVWSSFSKNNITNAKLFGTAFMESEIKDIVFEGTLTDCRFENCAFYRVVFQNTTLINTFFKNNKKFNRVKFVDCKVDKLTYAFLKSNMADLTGVTIMED